MTRQSDPFAAIIGGLFIMLCLLWLAAEVRSESESCNRRCGSDDVVWLSGMFGPVCLCRDEVPR